MTTAALYHNIAEQAVQKYGSLEFVASILHSSVVLSGRGNRKALSASLLDHAVADRDALTTIIFDFCSQGLILYQVDIQDQELWVHFGALQTVCEILHLDYDAMHMENMLKNLKKRIMRFPPSLLSCDELLRLKSREENARFTAGHLAILTEHLEISVQVWNDKIQTGGDSLNPAMQYLAAAELEHSRVMNIKRVIDIESEVATVFRECLLMSEPAC